MTNKDKDDLTTFEYLYSREGSSIKLDHVMIDGVKFVPEQQAKKKGKIMEFLIGEYEDYIEMANEEHGPYTEYKNDLKRLADLKSKYLAPKEDD